MATLIYLGDFTPPTPPTPKPPKLGAPLRSPAATRAFGRRDAAAPGYLAGLTKTQLLHLAWKRIGQHLRLERALKRAASAAEKALIARRLWVVENQIARLNSARGVGNTALYTYRPLPRLVTVERAA